MIKYPEGIAFKYPWRKYQQRVLDDLQSHLSDKHLHVVAPPGSGKTVLGLEVAIRINKPTLILAPTLAIRNQWIQRFCDLFLQTDERPDWISRDIRAPRFMTVVTYQGLHAACNNIRMQESELEEEEETDENDTTRTHNTNLAGIVRGLKAQQIQTIVVDEAHHLKNEWWQTLIKIKESLNPIIVGLTATPPYDVTATEWQRYIALNGPVDAEIAIPELIVEGDLCVHQDMVHFSAATAQENERIVSFRQKIEKLFQEIKGDETLKKALMNHPIWVNPKENLEWIYGNISCYTACLVYLHANAVEIPKVHFEIMGDKDLEVPKLNYTWIENLLDFYLYRDRGRFKSVEEHQAQLESKLRTYGALEKRQINFTYNREVMKGLTSSISKLDAIKDIVDFEHQQMGTELRLVVLSDYIRKEYFISERENQLPLNKLGVIPIFEKLRRENSSGMKIGVLTGSLIIIPKTAYSAFEQHATQAGIRHFDSFVVPFDENYIVIQQNEQLKNVIIHLVTEIFQSGDIEVLIGTKSLLGEGWDAPAINALVLASFVGSFVSSNQMRGRAIRSQIHQPRKTSNIWHLVTIDPTSTTGGVDFDLMQRRFKSFVGISFLEEKGIENGIGRLNLPVPILEKEQAIAKNQEMFAYAADRNNLKHKWEEALETGVSLVEEIKIPSLTAKERKVTKSLYFTKTIANFLGTLVSGMLGFGFDALKLLYKESRNIKTAGDLYLVLTVIGFVGMIVFGRQTYKTFRLYLKYRDIGKDMHKIGNALVQTFIDAQLIRTAPSELKVVTKTDLWGAVFCHLDGGTTFEKSIFIQALQEIIAPIESPRYLIVRKSLLLFFVKQKDYHAVPELIGKNKNLALRFKKNWKAHVGRCDLLFTRSLEGRKLVLQSRMLALSAQLDEHAVHVNKWR